VEPTKHTLISAHTKCELRTKDGLSLQAIAKRLNEDGQTTRRGKPWNAVQVSRVLERAAA